ncbi:DUF1206 domain-containing protein [Caulobacter ginsengisoli]|nr:DUF1206 domain-containing protein [Caulobacter ginsengisoli]
MTARVGYAARASVYLSIGAVALLAAFRVSPHAVGALAALEAWGEWPPGLALLWIAGLGLYAFAVWRGLQVFADIDRLGNGRGALIERAGKAVSGLIYAALGLSVFGLIDAMQDLHQFDDQARTQAWLTQVLAQSWGRPAVVMLGLIMVGGGFGNAVRSGVSDFSRSLNCRKQLADCAEVLARWGYFCRGVALLVAGVAVTLAGWRADATAADGLGGALEQMKALPFGHAILAFVALGLIAFGFFGLIKSGFRELNMVNRPSRSEKSAGPEPQISA